MPLQEYFICAQQHGLRICKVTCGVATHQLCTLLVASSATHQTSQQGHVLCPGFAQVHHQIYKSTSFPLLQLAKALLSSLGFLSAALPPQHHLHCQAAQASLVPPRWPQTTALTLKQSMPKLCSRWHYTSGLIPPVLHMLAKGKI